MKHLKIFLAGILILAPVIMAWSQLQPLSGSGGGGDVLIEEVEIVVEKIERGVVTFKTSVHNQIPGQVVPVPGNVRSGNLPDVKWKFSVTVPHNEGQNPASSGPIILRFTIKPNHPDKFPLKKGATLIHEQQVKRVPSIKSGAGGDIKLDFELIWKWEPDSKDKTNKGAFIINPKMDSGGA